MLALFAFAGIGEAQAERENPCADDEDNPCGDEQREDEGGESDEDPAEGVDAPAHESMTVAKGKVAVHGALGIALSADSVGNPIALAPDIVYGVMDTLDAGLYHSEYGLSGFWSQSGGGLCLAGDLCEEVYNGPTGILANFSLVEGKASFSVGGGLILSDFGETLLMDLKAGAKIRVVLNEKMSIIAEPALAFSLNERDPAARDQLVIPVALMYAVDSKIQAGVQTGFRDLLTGFGDAYEIPLNLAGMYQVDAQFGVGAAVGLSNIAGKEGTADDRDLTIFGRYAL